MPASPQPPCLTTCTVPAISQATVPSPAPRTPRHRIEMDFWNRLIGGSGSGSQSSAPHPSKAPPHTTPQERLAKFKRFWQTLLGSWRNARADDRDMLRSHVKRLTALLLEEEKSSARLCINFCYEQQVFIALSKIGQGGSPGVVRECIAAFATLIDNEDEDFLGNESFAQSLIEFLAATSARSTPDYEGEFVELLFSIAAKIRLNPEILRVWFTREEGHGGSGFESLEPQQKFAGITNKEDFPLFYLLIDYVHHEGRVGDFARTGLLYIIEATSSSEELEQWIVESDLATLMASGLGALYSQLSRKLVVTYPTEDPPTILVLSDFSTPPPAFGAEISTSPEFQTHLDTFLSYLVFWQDVLEHCRSAEVKQTLLDHFQILFLQQLLYPSLLESSDIDGGSSVAVLTYVRVVLDTLEHADMIHLVLSYLMNLPEKPVLESPTISMVKRRQSLDLLSQVAKASSEIENPTPAIYNLVDLIMTSLGSKSQQTVSATLRLVSTILRKHYPYSMNTLLKIAPVSSSAPARTIGAHEEELDILFTMVTDLSEENNAAQSYEDHLKDCAVLLESHPCSARLLDLKKTFELAGKSSASQDQLARMHMHTISPHDPLLRNLIDLLATFFSNTVETNLVLTCVIIDLAACAWMRPEGWLYFDPATYEFSDDSDSDVDDDAELDEMADELAAILDDSPAFTPPDAISADKERRRQRAIALARRRPRLSRPPPVIDALQHLVAQARAYRADIPDLDAKLAERRRAFSVTDELNDALLSGPISAAAPPPPPRLDAFSPANLVRPLSRQDSPTARLGRSLMGSPAPSPMRGVSPHASPFGSHIADTAQRRIKILHPGQKGLHRPPPPEESSREGSVKSAGGEEAPAAVRGAEFSLSHLLTNIMILQEFILELAALTQVRSSLFGDVKFV
ncbi:Retinoic acid induced 16-like protein-domain-containing protein, partial [Geopyxis carbonaria]